MNYKLCKKLFLIVVVTISLLSCRAMRSGEYAYYSHESDFWHALKSSFTLPETGDQAAVQKQIRWYLSNQNRLRVVATQAAPYLYYIHQEVLKRHMPGELALLPMIESSYNPLAYSRVGAAGLWQIMPGTGSGFGLKQDWWYDGRLDIYASTKAALNYLDYLHDYFNGKWLLAMAAYDSGEGTVQEAVKRNTRLDKSTAFWALKLPHETQNYVPRLLALVEIIRHPEKYHMRLPRIVNKPYFQQVNLDFQIDLAQAAKLANMSLSKLKELNPGYNRWATDPKGPYNLVLPLDKIDSFKQNIAKLPKNHRMVWQRHIVKQGESIGLIAQQYKTSATAIKKVNRLTSNNIRLGATLLIPAHQKTIVNTKLARERRALIKAKYHRGPQKVIHTVKNHESLWQLSRLYDVRENSIRFWNHLKNREGVRPGQDLIIWVPHKRASMKVFYYKIKSGDSLSKIAHSFHTNVKTLASWNNMTSKSVLHPGKNLIIKRG